MTAGRGSPVTAGCTCVQRKSGGLIVFEHKKGKAKHGKEAWPNDRLQQMIFDAERRLSTTGYGRLLKILLK
jgi:hypothetical protein